jgi:hypothetical protein
MKNVYLYNEDMSGYIQNNELPYSDSSEFISGMISEEFEDELYFNDKIKKAYKGQYYQNEIVFEKEYPDNGNFTCLEDGYYKIIVKANDSTPINTLSSLNDFWVGNNTGAQKPTNYVWKETTSDNKLYFQFFENDTTYNKFHKWFYTSTGEETISGTYSIYNQVLILYKYNEILNEEESIGVIDFSFINTEYLEDFRSMQIKCKNTEIFYGKTFNNSDYVVDNEKLKNDYVYIQYEGVHVNPGDEFISEYEKKDALGTFTRTRYNISSIKFDGYYPVGSAGYYEAYVALTPSNYNYSLDPNNGNATISTPTGNIATTKGITNLTTISNKKDYNYQYWEELKNYNFTGVNVIPCLKGQNGKTTSPEVKDSPLQSVGITTDIFGFHKYIQPTSGYIKIEFLGPKTLITVNSSYKGLVNKSITTNLPTGVTILQNQSINIPRNNTIKYDFMYTDDLEQVSRGAMSGEFVDTSQSYVLKYISGSENKTNWEISGLSGLFPINGINSKYPVSAVPLYEISHFKRNSDYSESIEFNLQLESYQFLFSKEAKKFRVYFNKNYIFDEEIEAYAENTITQILVDDKDITSDEFKYYEVTKKLANQGYPSDGYWAKIEIKYNRANWGLVRDFTAFSSKLVQLLNEEGAYWRYNSASRTDEIFVKLNRDINLDLSHQGQLYLLYITYIKENNTIDKEFSLNPLRLKLGRIPYTIQRGSSLQVMYLTEGEDLWLDWGFVGDPYDPDFIKKLYVNEILSVLPPEYTMYPINVWPYNQAFVGDTDKIPNRVTVSNADTGVDVDFAKVASMNHANDSDYPPLNTNPQRNKPFQVLHFRMPPQTLTIKLVISFQHYEFNFHRDDLGILDPYISSSEFIPGDIIKISFKLDKYHTLSNEIPDINLIKNTYSNDPFYKDVDKSYNDFLSIITALNSYSSDRNQYYKNEKKYSFYLLGKSVKKENIYPIEYPDSRINLEFTSIRGEMSNKRGGYYLMSNYEKQNIIFYNPPLGNKNEYNISKYKEQFQKELVDEEQVIIYLVGQDKDIDFWLTPRLLRASRLFSKIKGEIHYYQVEDSGWYSLFMSGGRCGNGGPGGLGLNSGEVINPGSGRDQKYDARSMTTASGNSITTTMGNTQGPHYAHNPFNAAGNYSYFVGRAGGDGGPGWIGGNGANGGQGTSLMLAFTWSEIIIKFSVWHFRPTIHTNIYIPCIALCGGKTAGPGGSGGKGKIIGSGAVGGTAMTLMGTGSGKSGTARPLFSQPRNFTFRSTKIFLKKGQIILAITGSNGNNGTSGDVLYVNGNTWNYFNLANDISYDQAANGGGGGPGTASIIFSLKNLDDFQENGTPYRGLYVDGYTTDDFNSIQLFRMGHGFENVGWLNAINEFLGRGSWESDIRGTDYRVERTDLHAKLVTIGLELVFFVFFQCVLYQDPSRTELPKKNLIKDKISDATWKTYPETTCSKTDLIKKLSPGSLVESRGVSEVLGSWSPSNSAYEPIVGGLGATNAEENILITSYLGNVPDTNKFGKKNNANFNPLITQGVIYNGNYIGDDDPGILFYFVDSKEYDQSSTYGSPDEFDYRR